MRTPTSRRARRRPVTSGPDAARGDRPCAPSCAATAAWPGSRRTDGMSNSLYGPLPDVAEDAGYTDPPERRGFFTDTSVCIGCKACEVACKEWNAVPDD